jgi:hypothetical protein
MLAIATFGGSPRKTRAGITIRPPLPTETPIKDDMNPITRMITIVATSIRITSL